MSEDATQPRKTFVIPDDGHRFVEDDEPLVAWGGDSDERDVRKPIAYDVNGNPIYASRGIRMWFG